ncbi:MAG: hemerythrin domain-containing protein [Candidatus Omnitrophica bacterium]|nr:hemerythrin domain-containing protein [Candidatus Omnitrophota bacterium]
MSPIQFLVIEHKLIERAGVQMLNKSKDWRGDKSCLQDLSQFIDFLCSYADLGHHGKEERILFAECELKNLSVDLKNLMEELKLEHVGFRKMQEKMCYFYQQFKQGDFADSYELDSLIQDYHSLLKLHEGKEESVFFPKSIKLFSESEQKIILERFSDFDQAILHEKYRQLVSDL